MVREEHCGVLGVKLAAGFDVAQVEGVGNPCIELRERLLKRFEGSVHSVFSVVTLVAPTASSTPDDHVGCGGENQ